MRRGSLRASILLVLLTTHAVHVAGKDEGPERIWILTFTQPQANASLEYLEEALPALLTVAFSAAGESHWVVERQQLNTVLAEQSLTLDDLISAETRLRIGKLLGATIMITGSFVPQGEQLLVTMHASNLETGIVVATAEGRGAPGEPGQLVSGLYRKLASGLDRRLPELAPGHIDEAPLANLHFMKGLGHYHSARYSRALAEFMLAVEDAGLADISRLWLANVYVAQEQYAHAYLELTRLTLRESSGVRTADVDAQIRACEKHLSREDAKTILELAMRRASAEQVASTALVTRRPLTSELYLGGRTVNVPLIVYAPAFDGLAVRADLVQLTSTLAMPVVRGIDVLASLSVRPPPDSAFELDWPVVLPSVNRETDFELRFRSSHPRAAGQQPAGRIRLRAYPADRPRQPEELRQ